MSYAESEANIAVINFDDSPALRTPKQDTFLKPNASEIVTLARQAFQMGKTKPPEFRKQQLKNLLRLLKENSEQFIQTLKQDLGRPATQTLMFDLNLCIYEVTKLIWNLDAWVKPEYPAKPLANMLDKLSVHNDPYGVVLVIGAWNFPINLVFGPVAGAIAGGNCVVIKPSEIAVATEQLITKLVPIYLDPDCYHIYTGGANETGELLKQRFDYIFFTGSPGVGKIVHAAANKYLTPVTLELGGKNPVYLDNTVDIERATRRILFGKCGNAGQICIAPDYLLCTPELQEKFVGAARKVLHDWHGNDPKPSTNYCKIVSERHFNRLVNFIQDNDKIALGGRFDSSARFIEPTILTNVSFKEPIMQEEIFGPILPIILVENVNDAIDIISNGEKPLSIYIFSNDKTTKNAILDKCSSGGVVINDTLTQFAVDTIPFGGVGLSGMGRYHGKDTFNTFVHKKSVLEKGYSSILETGLSFRYPPYTDFKMGMVDFLSKPRRGVSASTINTIITFTLGVLFAIIIQFLYKLTMHK